MLAWRLALRQLVRFPLRSGLLLACGGLAAALVIAALNYTAAGRAQLLEQLNAWGADVLTLTPTLSRSVGGRARTGTIVTTLHPADLAALLRAGPAIAASAQVATGTFLAKAGDLAKNNTNVAGVGAAYFRIQRWATTQGNVFSPADARHGARVALLGAAVARDLFGTAPATGQRLFLNRVPFTVAGVLAARGQRLEAVNEDEQIYIPFATFQHRLLNRDFDSAMLLRVDSPAAAAAVAADAGALLRRRHHIAPGQPDDFQILNQQTLVATRAAAGRRLAQLVRAAGAGGLLAAALALAALHALALGARRKELGIRCALGAPAAAMFGQLAAEAVLLALATALLAAGAGWALSQAAERRAALPAYFDLRAATVVIAAAVALDLAAALLAARHALRTSPAASLTAP